MSDARRTASMAGPEPRSAGRELVITRIIDAPRARVFTAWTDPTQLVMNMDRMIGADFEKGLASMKSVVEKK